jgi:hypothetical protein
MINTLFIDPLFFRPANRLARQQSVFFKGSLSIMPSVEDLLIHQQ